MTKESFKLIVDEKYEYSIEDYNSIENDVVAIGDHNYHTITKHKSVTGKIVAEERENKVIDVEIDSEVYRVKIEDRFDQLIKKMGLSASATKKLTDIKAPMPGLVLDIMVKEGDELSEGDGILILEAMKMENVIKAPGELTIKNILVKKGDAVEKNQNLINLE